MTTVAYLFVLGAATPAFRVAYELLPGMKLFRFPTRFLIVVELGIAILGAIGLTRLRADLEQRWAAPSRVPQLIVVAICAVTALDLFIHQPRQNPMVPAREWLAAPPSVDLIRAGGAEPRTFTPRHRDLHRRGFLVAHGWADVQPYFELRDVLEPNTGGGYLERAVRRLLRRHLGPLVDRRLGRSQPRSLSHRTAGDPRLRRADAARACRAPEGPENLRRDPRAQPIQAAGDGAVAGGANRECLRLPRRGRSARAVRAGGAPCRHRPGNRQASARLQLRSGPRDPAGRRARLGPSDRRRDRRRLTGCDRRQGRGDA